MLWLYNLAQALAAIQQQYLFHTYFSADGSATPTPKSAMLYGYKKACDYAWTFLSVGTAGSLSDKLGRRPLMAYSALGLAAGYVMVCRFRSPVGLLAAGCVDGLSSCMPTICQAYVGDVCAGDENKRARSLALLSGVALTGAFLVGFPLSIVLAAKLKSYRIPIYVAAASQLLNVLVIAAAPESRPPRRATAAPARRGAATPSRRRIEPPWAALKAALRTRKLRTLAIAYLLVVAAQSALDDCFLLVAQSRFGWGQKEAGPVLLLVGVLLAAVPQILVPRLGVDGSIRVGLPLFAAGYAALSLATTIPAFVCAVALLSIGCVCLPTMLVYLTSLVPDEEKGGALGAAESLRTLAKVVSSCTAPATFAYFTSARAPFRFAGAPFAWATVLAVATIGIQGVAMALPSD